jgi:8-oxo-dGTP diphosphatase
MTDTGAFSVMVGRSVRAARAARGLGQEQVAARMRVLGFTAWLRQTVGQVERGKRRLVVDEVLALSLALQTTIAELIMPAADEETVELPNGEVVSVALIRDSIRGARELDIRWVGDRLAQPGVLYESELPAIRQQLEQALQRIRDMEEAVELTRPGRVRRSANIPVPVEDELPVDDLASRPIPVEEGKDRPVVAAIITSDRGMLISRRREGEIRWGFITGKIEPDESPKDAAEREVKEETGLEVRAGAVIGERNPHPATGKHMIYMAATPTGRTDVFVGDEEELAEVQWVTLAEADELMPTMYGPVREHLARELGES